MKLSKHFDSKEFDCRHCKTGGDTVDPSLVELLEVLREHFNKPVIVTSGYRCPEHNRAVGGAKRSQHLFGTAADIQVKGVDPKDVADYLDPQEEAKGLGRYNTFTHVDVRSGPKVRWGSN